MTRFFRSLILYFCTTSYMVSMTTTNYERYKRPISNRPPPIISSLSFSSESDYLANMVFSKNRRYSPKPQQKQHRSVGLTSKFSRRSVRNNRTVLPTSLINSFNTTRRVISWTWPTPTVTTTVLPPSPAWLPSKKFSNPLTIILPSVLSSQNSAVNSTVNRLKEYLKTSKNLNRLNITKTKKHKPPKRSSTPSLANRKTLKREIEDVQQLSSMRFKKRITRPKLRLYPIEIKNEEKQDKFDSNSHRLFVNNLGDKIEAAEAERLASSDDDNPLKYLVKDGILYKKNKIPVARISLSSMKIFPFANDLAQNIVSETHKNSMMDSSKKIALLNSINRAVTDKAIMKSRKPSVPLSPPTARLRQEHVKIIPVGVTSTNQQNKNNNKNQIAVHPSVVHSSTMIVKDPTDVHMDDINDDLHNTIPPYPFSHCYMNIDGLICCNRLLESLMRKSFRKLQETHRFHQFSVRKIANQIQIDSENVFNTTFDTIVGIDDYTIRVHFAGDLICKIQEGGRFITTYATAMPTRPGVPLDPLYTVTEIEVGLREEDLDQNSDYNPMNEIQAENQMNTSTQRIDARDSIDWRRENREDIIPFHEMSREDVDNDYTIIT